LPKNTKVVVAFVDATTRQIAKFPKLFVWRLRLMMAHVKHAGFYGRAYQVR